MSEGKKGSAPQDIELLNFALETGWTPNELRAMHRRDLNHLIRLTDAKIEVAKLKRK